jgi:pimeloyl-ACP methyl ester carboxylesterase
MKKLPVFIVLMILLPGIACNTPQQPPGKGTVRAGNLSVYYERTGKGEPILFVHAGLQDHTMWEEQVKTLSAQYDVITPDMPFHGQTTGTDTTILAAEVIKILLDSLHIQKTSIAGLSMGSSIAQDFVIAYPERVHKAIFIASGIYGYFQKYGMDSVSSAWDDRMTPALEQKDTVRAAKEFTKTWAEGIYRNDSLQAPVSKYVYKTTLANLYLHKMQGWPRLQHHPMALDGLPAIRVPVLVIDGDKDLPIIGACSQYLEKNIPGARRVVMKDVAHMLNLEKPEAFNKLVMDFLKSK